MLFEIIVISLLSYQLVSLIVYFSILKQSFKINKKQRPRAICFLIAHPDDEVLFFGPGILNLIKEGNQVHILCLTNGNYYGQGSKREDELRNSCRKLDKNIILKIEPKFEDNPEVEWDLNELENVVTKYMKQNRIDSLITFDEHGISSHVNHKALNKAIPIIKENNKNLIVYTLKTCFVLRKYFFLFDLLPTLLFDLKLTLNESRKSLFYLNTPRDYLINIGAMCEHKTQLMWFRYLYILSSRYMFINYFVLVE